MPFDFDITERLDFKMAEARLLTLLLESRFGPLTEDVRERLKIESIDQVSRDQIEQWGIRALRATNMAEVFAD